MKLQASGSVSGYFAAPFQSPQLLQDVRDTVCRSNVSSCCSTRIHLVSFCFGIWKAILVLFNSFRCFFLLFLFVFPGASFGMPISVMALLFYHLSLSLSLISRALLVDQRTFRKGGKGGWESSTDWEAGEHVLATHKASYTQQVCLGLSWSRSQAVSGKNV